MDGPNHRTIDVQLAGAAVTIGLDEMGRGPSIVLLPALSSISTRAEMRPLLQRLASAFRVLSVDWPGFGDLSRPYADWCPDMLSSFLDRLLGEVLPPPVAIVAAGHAATYALHQVVHRPGVVRRLVLIAPTWRGPLPTMMGRRPPWLARVRAAVDLPGVGAVLYRLNVSRPVLHRMADAHVYSAKGRLSGDILAEKQAVTRAAGARHASVRFVTGALDRVTDRSAFLDLARRAGMPILVIYGDETPRKSRAEMEALAELPSVTFERMPMGKLAIHEEAPDRIAAAIAAFLDPNKPPAAPLDRRDRNDLGQSPADEPQ